MKPGKRIYAKLVISPTKYQGTLVAWTCQQCYRWNISQGKSAQEAHTAMFSEAHRHVGSCRAYETRKIAGKEIAEHLEETFKTAIAGSWHQ